MDNRDEFRQRWQTQIEHLSERIEELKTKAGQATAEIRAEMAERIRELEGQREKARAKLSELVDAGEDVWEEVAEEAEELLGKLKTGVEGFVSRFRGRTGE